MGSTRVRRHCPARLNGARYGRTRPDMDPAFTGRAWPAPRRGRRIRSLFNALNPTSRPWSHPRNVCLPVGATVAFLGSVPSTMFYFASYEVIKRALQPWAPDSIAHLTAGGFSDFLASALVAPWEVRALGSLLFARVLEHILNHVATLPPPVRPREQTAGGQDAVAASGAVQQPAAADQVQLPVVAARAGVALPLRGPVGPLPWLWRNVLARRTLFRRPVRHLWSVSLPPPRPRCAATDPAHAPPPPTALALDPCTEKIKQSMLRRSHRGPHAATLAPGSLTTSESLVSGAIAGTIAGAVTTPLDVIKTRLQTDVVRGVAKERAPTTAPLSRSLLRSLLRAHPFSPAPRSLPHALPGGVWQPVDTADRAGHPASLRRRRDARHVPRPPAPHHCAFHVVARKCVHSQHTHPVLPAGVGRGAWGQWTLPQSSIMFVVYEEILSFMLLTFPPSPETARMRTSVSL